MASILPDSIGATAIAADGVLCLTDRVSFNLGAGTWTFRAIVDCGQINIAAGTAGVATIGCGLWVNTAATAAPTSWATRDYGHRNVTVTRHATLDQSFPLGAMVIDQSIVLTEDEWEVYVGLGVESVGDLNGVNVTGVGPSGIIQLGLSSGSDFF